MGPYPLNHCQWRRFGIFQNVYVTKLILECNQKRSKQIIHELALWWLFFITSNHKAFKYTTDRAYLRLPVTEMIEYVSYFPTITSDNSKHILINILLAINFVIDVMKSKNRHTRMKQQKRSNVSQQHQQLVLHFGFFLVNKSQRISFLCLFVFSVFIIIFN